MKKVQYSKVLATFSLILFIFVLVSCLGLMGYLSVTGNGAICDYAVLTTVITVVGGVFGMTAKHYYSKSALENTASIKRSFYEEVMNVRIKYDKNVLELMNKYDKEKCEIDEIENDAPFKQLSENLLNQVDSKFDEVDSSSMAEPETEVF